nr:MAG TPA: hypothetical protein [Caudoviricetes sp.]
MTIKCIEERVKILEHMWNERHNKKVCNILLNQLTNDIVFFLGVKLPKDLEERIDKIDKEINE